MVARTRRVAKEAPKPASKATVRVKVKVAEKPIVIDERSNSRLPISFDGVEQLPQIMTDILYGWKEIGNPWATSLEAELALTSKRIKFDNPIDDLNAIRALHYMGYMDKCEPSARMLVPVYRYRLSKKGLKAVGASENLQSVDCPACKGEGVNDNGDICKKCKGEGTILSTGMEPVKSSVSSPQRTSAVSKTAKPTNRCERCKGKCVLPDGDVCPDCDGTGEKLTRPVVKSTVRVKVKTKRGR